MIEKFNLLEKQVQMPLWMSLAGAHLTGVNVGLFLLKSASANNHCVLAEVFRFSFLYAADLFTKQISTHWIILLSAIMGKNDWERYFILIWKFQNIIV